MKNFICHIYDRDENKEIEKILTAPSELEALLDAIKIAGSLFFDDCGTLADETEFFKNLNKKYPGDVEFFNDIDRYITNEIQLKKLHISPLAEIKQLINDDYGFQINISKTNNPPEQSGFHTTNMN